jgi:hypothetical protein
MNPETIHGALKTMATPHLWTPAELRLLRRLYPDHPTADIAARLGVSLWAIHHKAQKLHLKKSDTFMASVESGRRVLGNTPWNKGMKGLDCGGRRGWFGERPSTKRPLGSEYVSQGYIYRKVDDTGDEKRDWMPVHHLVWREAGREIPPSHMLTFRDGDKRNFDLDNLELLSRGEQISRYSINNYGPEIRRLSYLRGEITKQINRRSKT